MSDVPPSPATASDAADKVGSHLDTIVHRDTNSAALSQARALYDQAKLLEEKTDYEAARALLLEAVEKYNYPPALNEYGDCLYYGRGGPADEEASVKYFTLAADQEDALGLWNLAYMHLHKRGGLGDADKGKALLKRSAEKGWARAQQDLNDLAEMEEIQKHDIEVVEGVRAAAEGGDLEARLKLGRYYQYGTMSLDADHEKAIEHVRIAAEGGHAPAMFEIGRCYDYGLFSLQEDDAVALEWYRRAADQAFESAICKVGEFYENGYGGLEANIEVAKEHYRKAGTSGEYEISRLEKPERDRAELQRLTEAASGGDLDAQCELGKAYQYGFLGLTSDMAKMLELFQAAADAGHAEAQLNLGECYLRGGGTRRWK